MASATLAQFIALNDQLVALVKAGVPVHLGLAAESSATPDTLERIGAAVARRVGEGAPLSAALAEPHVPPAYRSVVELALASGDLPAALAGATRTGEALDDSWHVLRLSLLYPLIVCTLAYVGLVLFCVVLVPILENMQATTQVPPGSGLRAASALRGTLWYWIAFPPLALVLLAGWTQFPSGRGATGGRASRLLAWLPGTSRTLLDEHSANFAETLAGLLEAGVPLPEGLRLAAAAWEDPGVQHSARAFAASLEEGRPLPADAPFLAQLPPFLRWALWQADDAIERPRALRMAAAMYRHAARRRVERLKVSAPLIACIVIGGGVTLLYGLTLFVPLAQMIRGLAS